MILGGAGLLDVWTVGTIALHRHDDDRESTGQCAQSRVPISTGVCGDQCGATPISVAVVCGDQCDAVLISLWMVGTIALHHHGDGRESTGQRAPSVCRSA